MKRMDIHTLTSRIKKIIKRTDKMMLLEIIIF